MQNKNLQVKEEKDNYNIKNFSFENLKVLLSEFSNKVNINMQEMENLLKSHNENFSNNLLSNLEEDFNTYFDSNEENSEIFNNIDKKFLDIKFYKHNLISTIKNINDLFYIDDNGNFKYDLIKKCKEYLNHNNLNDYIKYENNQNLRIINYNNDIVNKNINSECYYFGETLSNKPDIANGFGFVWNKKESEIYLGNFSEDKFINGIWIRNKTEISIGKFEYENEKNKKIRTSFNGIIIIIEKRVEKNSAKKYKYISSIYKGYFKFINSEFKGISIIEKEKGKTKEYKSEIQINIGSFENNKKNSKDILSLVIPYNSCDKKLSSNYKFIIPNYRDNHINNHYYVMEKKREKEKESSILKILKISQDKKLLFSEILIFDNIFFRGEINYEEGNIIKFNKGILFDFNKKIFYSGEFNNNKKEGKSCTLILFMEKEKNVEKKEEKKEIENYNIYNIKKLIGEFKDDIFIGGDVFYNDKKVIENAKFNQNLEILKGKVYYSQKEFYFGDFYENLRDGYGLYNYANNKKYEGYWKKGMKNGIGTLKIEGNKFIKGEWENNKLKKLFETNVNLKDVIDRKNSNSLQNEIDNQFQYNNNNKNNSNSIWDWDFECEYVNKIKVENLNNENLNNENLNIENENLDFKEILLNKSKEVYFKPKPKQTQIENRYNGNEDYNYDYDINLNEFNRFKIENILLNQSKDVYLISEINDKINQRLKINL